jgi:hypothetical protein
MSGLVGLGLLLSGGAQAQIALIDGGTNSISTTGNVTGDGYTTGATNSMSFTVSPGANAMVLELWDRNAEAPGSGYGAAGATWVVNGTTQTVTQAVEANSSSGTYSSLEIYYLYNPMPGTGVISVVDTNLTVSSTATNSPVQAMTLMAFDLSGVNTTTPPATFTNCASTTGSTFLQIPNNGFFGSAGPVLVTNGSFSAFIGYDANGSGGLSNICTNGMNVYVGVANNQGQTPGYVGQMFPLPAPDGTTYAVNDTGGSTKMAMAVAVFTPVLAVATPTNVAAAGSLNPPKVAVTWNDASSGAASGYIVWRSTAPSSGYNAIATNTGFASTSYTDTNVVPWTEYFYTVSANAAGGSPATNGSAQCYPWASVSAQGIPSSVQGLSATNGINSVLLNWSIYLPSGSIIGSTNFTVTRSLSSSGPWTTIANGFAGTNYTDSTVTEGTLYYYEVVANNYYGSSPSVGPVSAIPCVAFFTNFISIDVDNTCTNGWVYSPSSSDGVFFSDAGVMPPPSSGYLILDGWMGTNYPWMAMTTNLPNLNLSTYVALQMDIQNIGNYWDEYSQLQQICPLLYCGGGTSTNIVAETGVQEGLDGAIILLSFNNSVNLHVSLPLSSIRSNLLTVVTGMELAVTDADWDTGQMSTNQMDIGFANIEFTGAPGYLPVYSNTNSPVISTGAPSATLSGTVGAPIGTGYLYLWSNTVVTATINGVTQSGIVDDFTGDFSINFTSPPTGAGTYKITYTNASDQVSFVGGTGVDQLTVSASIITVPPPKIPPPKLNAAGTALLVTPGGNTASGHTYYLLQTANLSPPVVWTTNTSFAGTGGPVTNSVPINTAKDLYLKYQVN